MATVKALVVAAGGGGGRDSTNSRGSSGGGGGGVLYDATHAITAAGSYAVVVGVGGLGGTLGSEGGTNGGNSSFDTMTSIGGGHGAGVQAGFAGVPQSSGGSGGGGDHGASGAAGTVGQGNNGGAGQSVTDYSGGGGGGAGSVGGNGNTSTGAGGNGGSGLSNSISGAAVLYSGGGSGAGVTSGTTGSGTGNYGHGGDGKRNANGNNGIQGVVIISYASDGSDGIMSATGGTITTVGSQKIHTFTSNGNFVVTATVPIITTNAVSNIKQKNALASLTEVSDGLAVPTSMGFVFSKTSKSQPGNVTPFASGYEYYIQNEGSFPISTYQMALTQLDQNTTYYVRGYMKNSIGYGYSANEIVFTTAKAPPAITSITPNGSYLSTATPITITGTSFLAGATVTIDGVACTSITVVNSNTITCIAPSSAVRKIGSLVVTNTDAQSTSAPFYYTPQIPAPTPKPAVTATFTVRAVSLIE